jgi:hypothetical protein
MFRASLAHLLATAAACFPVVMYFAFPFCFGLGY